MQRIGCGILALFLSSASQAFGQSTCTIVPEPPPDFYSGLTETRDVSTGIRSYGNALGNAPVRISRGPNGERVLHLPDTAPLATPGPAFTPEELTNKGLDDLDDLRARAINSIGICENEITAIVGECSQGGVFISSRLLQAKLVELSNRRIELERIRNELNRRLRLMSSQKPREGDPPGDGERDKAREIRDDVWEDYGFVRKRQGEFRQTMRDMDWTWMARSGDPASGPAEGFSWGNTRDVFKGRPANPGAAHD